MKPKLFFTAIVCLAPLRSAVLPDRSELEIRLLHQVGSHVSHVGDLVQAAIISPVFVHDTILLPAGATVSGVVDHLDRRGLGLRHPVARLDLHFTQLHLSDGTILPIDGRVASIEEAREVVSKTGEVMGIQPGASLSTGVSCLFTLFFIGEPEFRLPILVFKFLAARSPDAEITFPAGTEMVMRLNHNAQVPNPGMYEPAVPRLATFQIVELQNLLATLPQQRTSRNDKQPSDLINILLIGSQQEVERAFRAAGWNGTEPHGIIALYRMYHCMVQRAGYSRAPMTNLKFHGNPPDTAFQKSLDTLAKRHHIRLWHEEQSRVWFGAATEDVKYELRALHLTHGTDRYIDNERAKVVNDLTFTGCIDRGALVPRTSLNRFQEDANSILTDGDVAVLELNACNNPHLMPSDPKTPRPVRAIRVALAVGEDIARSNPVSVGYAMTKSMFDSLKTRANERVQESGTYTRAIAISSISETAPARVLALR
jgi:hypothetical protein